MGRLLTGLALLFVIVTAAALAVPPLVDWSALKPAIERHGARIAGAPVTVRGPVSLRLLPLPVISVAGLDVAHADADENGPAITMAAAEAELSPWPLISGQIELRRLSLTAPRIGEGGASLKRLADELLPLLPEARAFTLAVVDAEGPLTDDLRATEVSLDLHADRAAGPYSWTGSARVNGQAVRFTGSLAGRPGGADPAALRMGVRLTDADADITVIGTLNHQSGADFSGTARLRGRNLGRLADTLALVDDPHAPAPGLAVGVSIDLSAQATLKEGQLALRDVDLAAGTMRAAGAADVILGHTVIADLSFTAPTLRLASAGAAAEMALLSAGFEALFDRIARPAFSGSINFNSEIAELGFGTVRSFSLSATPDGDSVRITGLSGRLPGGGQARLSGTVSRGGNGLAFAGPVQVEAPDLNSLAEAMFPGDRRGGGERLPARIETTLRIDAGTVDLSSLTARLGDMKIEGAVTAERAMGTLRAALHADEADLDLLADTLARHGRAVWPDLAKASVSLTAERATAFRTEMRNLDFTGTMGTEAVMIDRLSADDVMGMRLAAAGRLPYDLGGHADFAATLTHEPEAGSGEEGDQDAGAPADDTAFFLAELRLGGEAEGDVPGDGSLLRLSLRGDGLEGGANGVVSGMLRDPEMDLAVVLSADSAARLTPLLRRFGAEGLAGDTRLRLAADVRGQRDALALRAVTGSIGRAQLSGAATLALDRARPALSGDFHLDAVTIDTPRPVLTDVSLRTMAWPSDRLSAPWLGLIDGDVMLAVDTLDLGGMRIDDARARLALSGGTLTIDDASGVWSDGRLVLRGVLTDDGEALAARLSFTLDGARMPAPEPDPAPETAGDAGADEGAAPPPLWPAGGDVSAKGDLMARGASLQALARSLSGAVEVNWKDGVLRGDYPALETGWAEQETLTALGEFVHGVMAGGRTAFDRATLRLRLEDGRGFLRDSAIESKAGVLSLSGAIDVSAWVMHLRSDSVLAPAREDSASPVLGIVYNGPLDAPDRDFDLADVIEKWAINMARTDTSARFREQLPIPLQELLDAYDEDAESTDIGEDGEDEAPG